MGNSPRKAQSEGSKILDVSSCGLASSEPVERYTICASLERERALAVKRLPDRKHSTTIVPIAINEEEQPRASSINKP